MAKGSSDYLKEFGKCKSGHYKDVYGRIVKGNCVDGKKNGPWTVKNEKGDLIQIRYWILGELQSEINCWGDLNNVIYFKNNKKIAEFNF